MNEFTQFGNPVLDIVDKDLELHLTNTGALVYIEAKGWVDVATAKCILEWLQPKIPRDGVQANGDRNG